MDHRNSGETISCPYQAFWSHLLWVQLKASRMRCRTPLSTKSGQEQNLSWWKNRINHCKKVIADNLLIYSNYHVISSRKVYIFCIQTERVISTCDCWLTNGQLIYLHDASICDSTVYIDNKDIKKRIVNVDELDSNVLLGAPLLNTIWRDTVISACFSIAWASSHSDKCQLLNLLV